MASPQIGFLRRATQPYGQNCIKVKSSCCAGVRSLPNPMGVQFFKFIFLHFWFQIQISHEKVSTQTIFIFSIFLQEHGQNWEKPPFHLPFWTYLNFSQFFLFLTMFPSEFWKNKTSLCTHFFTRNLNLKSKLQKNEFGKLTSHRGRISFRPRRNLKISLFFNFNIMVGFLTFKTEFEGTPQ